MPEQFRRGSIATGRLTIGTVAEMRRRALSIRKLKWQMNQQPSIL
jgi:hypothetical protein